MRVARESGDERAREDDARERTAREDKARAREVSERREDEEALGA